MTQQFNKDVMTPMIGFGATGTAFLMKFIDTSQMLMEWFAVLVGVLIGVVTLAIQVKRLRKE